MFKCNVSIVLRPRSSCSHPVPGRFSWRSWTSPRQWLRPQCQRQPWRKLCPGGLPGQEMFLWFPVRIMSEFMTWRSFRNFKSMADLVLVHWLFQTSIQTSKGWSWHWQCHAQIKSWVTPWESLYWGMNMLLCVCMDLLCCSAEVLRVLCMVAFILYDIFPYFSLACSTQLDMAHKMRYVPLRCTFSIPMSHRVTVQACIRWIASVAKHLRFPSTVQPRSVAHGQIELLLRCPGRGDRWPAQYLTAGLTTIVDEDLRK